MPLAFIPAGVGLLNSVDEAKSILVPLTVISVVSTVFVMAVTGRVAQNIIRGPKKRKGEKNEPLAGSSLYFWDAGKRGAYSSACIRKKTDLQF